MESKVTRRTAVGALASTALVAVPDTWLDGFASGACRHLVAAAARRKESASVVELSGGGRQARRIA